MTHTEELQQLIDQRKTIIYDLQHPNEAITGVGIRFQTKSTSFLNTDACDFSDIVAMLIQKVTSEINSLETKLPAAQAQDDKETLQPQN